LTTGGPAQSRPTSMAAALRKALKAA